MVLDWAKDWVVDKVYGVAKTGLQAGGNMAGNAVGSVSTLIEDTGRETGRTIGGAIGGVGSSINNYGQNIIDSTAASPGVVGEKKHAVKPLQTVSKSTSGTQQQTSRRNLPAITKSGNSLPSTKAKASSAGPNPTALSTTRQLSASTRTSPPKPLKQPSKLPPPAPNRNLPASKPHPRSPRKPAGTSNLPKISASASDRTSNGKTRISAASRPQPPTSKIASGPVKSKTSRSTGGSKPLPKISAGKNDRNSEGKVRISSQSRPGPFVSTR